MYVYVIVVERFDIRQELDQSGNRIANDVVQVIISDVGLGFQFHNLIRNCNE